jgi:SAM-dependent methyltransferase
MLGRVGYGGPAARRARTPQLAPTWRIMGAADRIGAPLDPRRFDESYYRRFYGGPERVHGAREIAHLASGVAGIAAWLGVDVRSVLDVGAGVGLWRRWFRRHRPRVQFRSIDVSEYACRAYGHERRDISAWRARHAFDLIVFHSVLQYMRDADAARAIDNVGRMCRGLLYLETVTSEDAPNLDLARTDTAIHVRPAAWYRARLSRHFVQVGAGLWASRRANVALYALEAPAPSPAKRVRRRA